jgi:ATP-dependent protease ClpP protease subunit
MKLQRKGFSVGRHHYLRKRKGGKGDEEPARKRGRGRDRERERDDSEDEAGLRGGIFGDEEEEGGFGMGGGMRREGNHLYFESDVTKRSIAELCEALNEVALDNICMATQFRLDPIPIYLHINSNGGSVFAAFTAIDNIMQCPVPVYTVIEGASASAATIMSVVGKKRFIRPNSYMLVHELRSGCWGRMSEMEDEMVNLKRIMRRIKKVYKNHTQIPAEEMKEILKHDMWWDAEKCLEMGLVDGFYEG